MTVAEIARRHGRERPEHPAFTWVGGARTYAELDQRSNRAGQALRAHGIGPGDRFAILAANSPEQIEIVCGAAKIGAVPVLVNWRLAGPEVVAIVEDAEAKLLIKDPDLPAVDSVETVSTADYEDWIGAQPGDDPGAEPDADDVALQFYSSGTTGTPKGVELTHANLFAVLDLWDPAAGLGSEAVSLNVLPMFHIGGMAVALAGNAVGATNALAAPTPDGILDCIEQEGVTHAALVPAILQMLLGVPGVEQRDFSRLKVVIYGASPINDTALTKLINLLGCDFFQAYGLTETASTIVMLRPEDHDPGGPRSHLLRSCGKVVEGSELRVVDPATGSDAAVGEPGEVWLKGPSVMKGYWNQPELTAEAITDGWFHSGDIGSLDEEGFLFLHDRLKDMIVSGGENIYPAEVENALASHPAVVDVAVIGVPSEKWGETVKAVVVRDGEASEDELLAHCRERLARYKCPTSVDWTEELPRSATGKVLKRELREPYWEGQGRSIG